MPDMKIVKQGFLHAALAVLYIAVVATVMANAARIFGPDEPKGVIAPVSFLLLFVVSAATMGMLVFGKPAMLYIDGKKREAVGLVVSTIASLAAILVLLFAALALSRA